MTAVVSALSSGPSFTAKQRRTLCLRSTSLRAPARSPPSWPPAISPALGHAEAANGQGHPRDRQHRDVLVQDQRSPYQGHHRHEVHVQAGDHRAQVAGGVASGCEAQGEGHHAQEQEVRQVLRCQQQVHVRVESGDGRPGGVRRGPLITGAESQPSQPMKRYGAIPLSKSTLYTVGCGASRQQE